jgi:hypothetical protein
MQLAVITGVGAGAACRPDNLINPSKSLREEKHKKFRIKLLSPCVRLFKPIL